MLNINQYSKWVKLAVIAMFVMLILTIASSGAMAQSSCKKVNGKLTVNPDTTGSYKGDIKGTSVFTADGFPSPTGVSDVVLLTGSNTIHTDNGDLMTRDAVVLRTTGAGEFAEVDTVVGGTGAWAGATGVIQATGTFNFTTGGTGDYIGEICTP